jgi:hypothetical protein
MRQQRRLHPIFAIDEPMHRHTLEAPSFRILKKIRSERNPTARKSQAVFTRAGPLTALAAKGRPSLLNVPKINARRFCDRRGASNRRILIWIKAEQPQRCADVNEQ